MDCVNGNTDIMLSEKPKVGCNIKGMNEDGKWNHGHNEETGQKTDRPNDPDYFNTYYHANKKLITCDLCGCVVVKKIREHKKTMKCRLANFILQYKLKLKEDGTS